MLITTTEGISSILPVTSKPKLHLLLALDRETYFVCSQDETSEQFIGEWAESRGIRDQLVIATKVGSGNARTAQSHLHLSSSTP